MATTTDRVLAKLDSTYRWVKDGPQPSAAKPFRYAMLDDWSTFTRVEFDRPDAFAVSLDEEDLFADQLDQLAIPGHLQGRNPSCLIFRIVDQDTGVREAVAFIKRAPSLGETEVRAAIQYGAYDPDAARLHAAVNSSLVQSGVSTRAPARRRD